jgi:TFIIH basal transcription factor complex TTD-A subunit
MFLNLLQDLDETHLFITQEVLELLQEKIDDLMDKISVPVVEGRAADSK